MVDLVVCLSCFSRSLRRASKSRTSGRGTLIEKNDPQPSFHFWIWVWLVPMWRCGRCPGKFSGFRTVNTFVARQSKRTIKMLCVTRDVKESSFHPYTSNLEAVAFVYITDVFWEVNRETKCLPRCRAENTCGLAELGSENQAHSKPRRLSLVRHKPNGWRG